MKDMDRQAKRDNFEYQWQKAFENEYVEPPNTIWDGIESSLASEQISRLTRQKQIYKWVATVSILFSCTLLIYLFTSADKNTFSNSYAFESSHFNSHQIDQEMSSFCLEDMIVLKSDKKEVITQNQELQSKSLVLTIVNEKKYEKYVGYSLSQQTWPDISKSMYVEENEPMQLLRLKKMKSTSAQNFANNQRDEKSPKLWAAISAGGGNYDMRYKETRVNPVITGISENGPSNFVNTSPTRAQNATQTKPVVVDPGYQSNINLSMGVSLNEKIIVLAGFQYSRAQVETVSNVILDTKYNASDIAVTGETLWTSPVSSLLESKDITEYSFSENRLINQFEFASIPVKIGYFLDKGRINLLFNTGVVTQFYLGNQLSDSKQVLDDVVFTPGKDSPYRQINFAGQGSIVVGYELLRYFSLTVEPSYSLAFHSQSKTETTFSTSPASFNVAAGIRYSFN